MENVNDVISLIITKKPSLKVSDVKEMIKKKAEELGELVDEYVIALMVAKELGISLPKEEKSLKVSKLKIRDLISGLRNVNLVARVIKIDREITFSRNGRMRRCLRIGIGDATGIINLVLWDEQVEQVKNLRIGDVIRISRGYTREYRGRIELYLGENGKISLVEGEAPPLEYFLENYELECALLEIKSIVRLPDFACIRGIDFKGRRVRVLIWGGLEDDLREKCYYICGLKKKYETQDFVEYYTNQTRAVFKPCQANIPPINYPIYTPSSTNIEEARDLVFQGYYLAVNPTKLPKMILGDNKKFLSILLTSDNVFHSITDLDLGVKVQLEGVDVVKGRRSRIVKISRCGRIRIVNSNDILSSMSMPEKYIVESIGACILNGAVISLDFNFRSIKTAKKEKIVPFCSMLVDDGTGQARIYSSSMDVIEKLLGMSEKEALDYLKSGVLDKIVSYMKKDILGKDFKFKCFLYEGEGNNRIGVAFSIWEEG
ncbi:MAG: hypothetical protein DRJ38_01250 [Thermoprotei archaeon]|nr:MAG: hypothetical protein DRJ38_01250 [Thermoprotei archaeon]